MALGDEQIERLGNVLRGVVYDFDQVATKKIAEIRELLNGITITNTVNVKEIKPTEKVVNGEN